jgi:hypothetical protein
MPRRIGEGEASRVVRGEDRGKGGFGKQDFRGLPWGDRSTRLYRESTRVLVAARLSTCVGFGVGDDPARVHQLASVGEETHLALILVHAYANILYGWSPPDFVALTALWIVEHYAATIPAEVVTHRLLLLDWLRSPERVYDGSTS